MENTSEITCRGCFVRYRNNVWASYVRKKHEDPDGIHLEFEPEPNNKYDPNAIKIVCRGSMNGNLGYVAKEMTQNVRDHLKEFNSYKMEMKDENEVSDRVVHLLIAWN